jgi:hypothetical protein
MATHDDREPAQAVHGTENLQAGRDLIQNIGLIPDNRNIQETFVRVDRSVREAIGDPISPSYLICLGD